MAIEIHNRRAMARAQLETALRLYAEGQELYSVITLAGAADEILGELLRANGRESSLDTLKIAVVGIHRALFDEELQSSVVIERANRARNAAKHWSPLQELTISFDSVEESRDMLNRAVDNFWTLEQTLSPAMECFQRAERTITANTDASERDE